VRGVRLVHLDRISDSRGSLLPFGRTPFDAKNVFFIRDCPQDAIRAEHATSCEEVIVALNSTVTVDLDNGAEQESVRLGDPEKALVVGPGVWLRLREFTEETALVVLSSEAHQDVERFDRPNPALLDAAER
jgi:WxcM-like protein